MHRIIVQILRLSSVLEPLHSIEAPRPFCVQDILSAVPENTPSAAPQPCYLLEKSYAKGSVLPSRRIPDLTFRLPEALILRHVRSNANSHEAITRRQGQIIRL